MFEWYENLPEWLRWVLFVPLSALGSLVGVIFYAIFRADDFAFVKPVFAMLITMFVVYSLAPRAKKQLALASLIIRMIVVAVMMRLVWVVEGYFEAQSLWEIGYELAGYIISFLVWWNFMKKDA
ncbi:MAG: hypothetical protein KKD63_05855 [Proteobacteria bacterium]|nr:hypothetical protein [Desulfobulbaceae bacterium]MBU4152384.1 hypothetical protein [Pseudomonadota bacterium]